MIRKLSVNCPQADISKGKGRYIRMGKRGTKYMRVGGGYVQQSFLSLSELVDNKLSNGK